MNILLNWLTTEGNYEKYRGSSCSQGKGKLYWANIISEQMKQAGIRKFRSPKAIKNKIMNLEDSFKTAHDWAGQTGAGLKDDDPGQFNDYILKKCPYYFDLLPVMQDRATCRPQMTSDSLYTGSDDDDEDDDDHSTVQVLTTRNLKHDDDASVSSSSKSNNILTSPSTLSSVGARKKRRTQLKKKDDPLTSVLNLHLEAIGEASRHNQVMENFKKIEMEHAQTELKHKEKVAMLQGQQMDLEHRIALVNVYDKIKGKISDEMIKKKFPELADFIESSNCNSD